MKANDHKVSFKKVAVSGEFGIIYVVIREKKWLGELAVVVFIGSFGQSSIEYKLNILDYMQ